MVFVSRVAACLALAVVSLSSVPPALAAPARPDELARVATALQAVATMRANFTQTDRQGRNLSGVVTLKRPGKVRFEYQRDTRLLIVSDGKALVFIDYAVRQVQRWPIRNSPLGALLDPSRDISQFGRVLPDSRPDRILVEVRDRTRPEYGVTTLTFIRSAGAPGGFELAGWTALDSQNRQTRVQLSNHVYGLAVPDSTFRWIDPRVGQR